MTTAIAIYSPAVHVGEDRPVVVLDPALIERIESLVERDTLLDPVGTTDGIPSADALAGEAHKLLKAIEESRKNAKAPFAELAKAIDSAAKSATAPLTKIVKRRNEEIAKVQLRERRRAEEAERERLRVEREAAEQERHLEEMRAAVVSDEDLYAAEELKREARRKSAEEWVKAMESTPAPPPKSHVHTRTTRVPVLIDQSKAQAHVNGICVVKSWDTALVGKLLKAGVEVPGWELQEKHLAVRR